MSSWLTTTLSVIAGGLLTMFSAWLADGRLRERDRERRREERQERFSIRRDDFQRETLPCKLFLKSCCETRVLRFCRT
jgi:hypothetical protein